ncbi:MAG TPA: helix-turn-helix domain-containing protein [Desulfobacterales bacterium]|nr:helix-turn-helix domain-containing protein [Desulfobacterales bacterium]
MKILNEHQAAEQLQLKVQTLRNWRHEGRGVPYVKVGTRKIGYLPEDLDRFVMSGRVIPACEGVPDEK